MTWKNWHLNIRNITVCNGFQIMRDQNTLTAKMRKDKKTEIKNENRNREGSIKTKRQKKTVLGKHVDGRNKAYRNRSSTVIPFLCFTSRSMLG